MRSLTQIASDLNGNDSLFTTRKGEVEIQGHVFRTPKTGGKRVSLSRLAKIAKAQNVERYRQLAEQELPLEGGIENTSTPIMHRTTRERGRFLVTQLLRHNDSDD